MCLLVFCGYWSQDLEIQEQWVSRYVSVGILWLPVAGSRETGTVSVTWCDNVYVFVCVPGCLCMCLLVICGFWSLDPERQEL